MHIHIQCNVSAGEARGGTQCGGVLGERHCKESSSFLTLMYVIGLVALQGSEKAMIICDKMSKVLPGLFGFMI